LIERLASDADKKKYRETNPEAWVNAMTA
jgi:hypothetical protein